MLQQEFRVRNEFTDKFETFCLEEDISPGKPYYLHGHQNYGIIGTPSDLTKVTELLKTLESDRKENRKGKSFLWRMFN